MVKGKIIEERKQQVSEQVNYRKLDALNQTMIKLFDDNPVEFYKQFKLGKVRKEKKAVAYAIGDMVDFYLLACRGSEEEFDNRFDEKFALFTGTKGGGQVFILADTLFEVTEEDTEDGMVKTSFGTRFTEAVRRIQIDGKYKGKGEDKILEDFEKNGKDYFMTLLDNVGKTVVDTSLVDKALNVGNKIKNDAFTNGIFLSDRVTEDTDGMMEYHTHLPIKWTYRIDSKRTVECKSEIDMLVIDHEGKVIYPRDLKTTYDNESFDYMYIKNGYYLQNAFYHKAVSDWAMHQSLDGYEIMPLEFVVGDTSPNNRRPLVYKTSGKDIEKGLKGFDLKGNHYRGIDELIREIAWCEEKDIWDVSQKHYQLNGRVPLSINYE